MTPIDTHDQGKDWLERGRSMRWILLGWLSACLCASAQVTVDTIGGGVRVECGSAAGFFGGNTYEQAQFNAPFSCALDTNGNLWIADKNNSDIEQVSEAGDKTDSITTEYYTISGTSPHFVTNYHAFTNVTAVAVDPANNLYVLLPSPPQVIKYSLTSESSTINLLSAEQLGGAPAGAVPSAMAVDASSNVFLAFTNGVILRFQMLDINPPPTIYSNSYVNGVSPRIHYVVNSFGWKPSGLALTANGQLAVSDTMNNAIWLVATNDYTANSGPHLLTGGNGAGYSDGSSTFAQFDQPYGLAASSDGHLVVCDTMNNRVRVIDTSSNTETIYGTGSNVWTGTCCSCNPTFYAGWVDGTAGSAFNSASGREPVSVVISPSGSLFVTELYYSLIREVTGAPLLPVNLNGTLAVAISEAATGISTTNGTLNGSINPGNETTSYFFEYGLTTNYGTFTATNQLITNLTVSQQVSAVINSLTPGTIYHYQLVAYNGFGFSFGGDTTIVTPAELPVIETLPATNITFGSATLQAIVNPEYSQTAVTFLWGIGTNLTNITTPIVLATNLAGNQQVSVTLSNLTEGAIYYFEAVASSSGGSAAGATLVFSTVSGAVVTFPATNVTPSSATLEATVNPGGSPATVYFQWGTTPSFGSLTAPVNVTQNLGSVQGVSSSLGNLQPDTTYYFQAVANNTGGTIYGNTLSFTTPPTLSFYPSNGYFPECVTIFVTSSVPTIYFTTDGSAPTTNSQEIILAAMPQPGTYSGSLIWCEPLLNLSALHLLASNGTNSSTLMQGGFPATNSIGFPQALSGGPGSHLYIPVAVQLQTNVTLQSLQFRVEINANQKGTPQIAPIQLQPLTPNDLVALPGPAPADAPVSFQTFPYTTSSNGQGLVITAEGGSSGLNMQGSGVVVMLHIQMPVSGVYGQSYSLNVLNPSGTSDGQQTPVGLTTLAVQTLTNQYTPYMVGDSSPSTGYNAQQFGDKGDINGMGAAGLANADVNNAIYASVGIHVPPSDSDIFNAMDAYPPDSAGHGGDGVIQFLDWQTILGRSLGVSIYLGMDTNNYLRYWTNGDTTSPSHSRYNEWIPGGPAVPLSAESGLAFHGASKLEVGGTPAGLVWFCQASVGSGTIVDALPGNTYSLPVYVNILRGYNVAGMQFRATVTGSTGAPAVSSIQFNPTAGVPAPMVLQGLGGNDKIQAWSFGSFATPLASSNLLGTISFQVPNGAAPGACYALHFSGVDGAPDFTVDYQMDSHPGFVWVMSAAQQPASITSDEWKMAFFGSLTSSQAADNSDADGDGALNWQEYLAGTNPTNSRSYLQFNSANLYNNGVRGIAINWLTAPGKTYVLQSSPALMNPQWTPMNTNTGDGNQFQCIVTNVSGTARFYEIRLQP
ncbi:MAG TPA: chitobiase/beta-hexosaminidase C-terminal domain-containing protein [Verrucomicrobiae bacterium]|jgi:hypothetical protein